MAEQRTIDRLAVRHRRGRADQHERWATAIVDLADLPDRVVDGDPHHESMTRYSGANGVLQAGTWTSTPGRWRVFGGRDEFCTLLSGRVALITASGERQEFGPGDSFLIPNGFDGFWEVMETATKHFVILHREPL